MDQAEQLRNVIKQKNQRIAVVKKHVIAAKTVTPMKKKQQKILQVQQKNMMSISLSFLIIL